MRFRYQVKTFSCADGVFTGNAVDFDTAEEATEAVKDLFQRWTAVEFWRVLDSDDNVIAEGP